MKVALLEVSHWHFPLYADALEDSGVQVVAISDGDAQVRAGVARRFGARAYADAGALLARETPDFAFVFGRHDAMMDMGLALIERGIPFSIEKPGGIKAAQLHRLQGAARARKLFVAVPFVQLLSPLYSVISDLVDGEGACFIHSSWRFFAGPPHRYLDAGNDWMLDPRHSGGGCLINLAPHFIDLVHRLHGPGEGAVECRLSNRLHATQVEDYAMLSMGCSGGATALVETGYCFPPHPAKREYSFSLVSASHYLRSCPEGICIHRAGAPESQVMPMDLDADPLYGKFVHRVLDDVRGGRAPVAGLADLAAVMEVVDEAHARDRARTARAP